MIINIYILLKYIFILVMGMGISKTIVLSILMLFVISLATTMYVYGYPPVKIDNKIFNIYSIATYIPIDTSKYYYYYGINVIYNEGYLFISMQSRDGMSLALIKYDLRTNRVVYNTTINLPYSTDDVDMQYLNGYIYVFYQYESGDIPITIVEIRDPNNVGNVISRYNLTEVLRTIEPNVNKSEVYVWGSIYADRGSGRIVITGKIDNGAIFVVVVANTSIEKVKIYDDIRPWWASFTYNGTHYIGYANDVFDNKYIVLDRDLNIVYIKSFDNAIDVYDVMHVWSKGVVYKYKVRSSSGVDIRYIGVVDWNFNTIKTYNITNLANSSDVWIDRLDVVNDVIIAGVDTDYTNYDIKILVIIDPSTDRIDTYILNTPIGYPAFASFWTYKDPNNTILYPAYYEVNSTLAYLSILAVSISTTATPSTITTTVVQPVPVYHTTTTTITTTRGISIEMNIIIVVAMIAILAIGLIYVLRRSR